MTGADFVQRVKVKLNRLDSNAYSDILPEEVLFFGTDALKKMTIKLFNGQINFYAPRDVTSLYLSSVDAVSDEITLTNNAVAIPDDVLMIKDIEVNVTVDNITGWVPARVLTTRISVSTLTDPFNKSFADKPSYELVENNIKFPIKDEEFVCNKIKIEYLIMPDDLATDSVIDFPFGQELEDETVTLILENLMNRRLQTQPTVSKS